VPQWFNELASRAFDHIARPEVTITSLWSVFVDLLDAVKTFLREDQSDLVHSQPTHHCDSGEHYPGDAGNGKQLVISS